MPSSLTGPCANPACSARNNASGQFQFLPKNFVKITDNPSGQVCKKADCLRWAGLKREKGTPGRKRAAPVDEMPTGVPVPPAQEPRPPIVSRIDEVWGMR